jgi:PAS domain S-box-containing protein/putative nucleotidyltransferase with HDIG domain
MTREPGGASSMPLFNSLMEGAVIIGADSTSVVLSNRAAAVMFGYESTEAMINVDLLDRFSPRDRERAAGFLAGCLVEGDPRGKMDGEVVTPDGRSLRVAAVGFPTIHEGLPARLILVQDVTEKRKAEEALREGEANYRGLFEGTQTGIEVVSVETGRVVLANEAAARMWGFSSASDVVGLDPLEFLEPADRGWVAERMVGVLAGRGLKETVEMRVRAQDGRWVWISGMAGKTEYQGRPALLISLLDVTEKRTAEDALKESERRYRLLADNVEDVIFLLNMEFEPTYFSPSVARLTGWSVEEAMSGTMEQRLTPRSFEVASHLLARAMADEQREPGSVTSRGFEMELACKDGSTRLVDATASFLRDAEGRVVGIVGTLHDITERRVAEDALIDSERRYRLLAENLSDVIWIVDQNLQFTFVSPSVERLLGYTAEEALATPTDRIVVPGSFEKAMKVMVEEAEKEKSGQSDRERSVMLELELPRKDGSTVWTENRVSYLRDADEVVVGFLGVSRDISQRKRAQDALKISEERFRTIFEESPVGAIVYDGAGVPLAANKACARIFGVSDATDLKGPSLLDDPLLTDKAKRRLRSGKVVTGEMEIDLDSAKRKGGYRYSRSGVMSVHLSASPLGFNPDGSASGYLALVEDVTQKRKADEALRASEERFRGLVETTSDWVWEVDRRGAYTYVSPKVSNVLGYDSQDMAGKTPFDFMPLGEARRGAAAFGSSVERQESFAFLENVMRHKDGHPVVMETSGVPFFGPDGKLMGYRGVGRDITERKETARRLEQSLRKLERTMEAIIQAISSTMETRDPYTAGHQKRVTQLASLLAKEMGLPASQVAGIRVAGLLHDIGKISIPTEILSKPGQLTASEMAMIRFHPSVGYDILKNIEFQWPVADIILQHHERLNGSGYPSGMSGEQILVEARILAVADVVEAMSSHRPYRPAVGKDKALQEIARGEGTLYDPVVVKTCLEAFNDRGFAFE